MVATRLRTAMVERSTAWATSAGVAGREMRAARAMARPGVRVADARSVEVSARDVEGSSLWN